MLPTTMPLMTLIWQQHRFAFIKVILLNLLNAMSLLSPLLTVF